jgi:hypothetical protein
MHSTVSNKCLTAIGVNWMAMGEFFFWEPVC